jgi:predicted transcriptional regulator
MIAAAAKKAGAEPVPVSTAEAEPVSTEVSGETGVAASAPRDALLNNARQAGSLAKEWRKSQIENDAELSAAAKNTAKSWREIACALTSWDFTDDDDDDDSFYEGAIDKHVASRKRHEREAKKRGEAIKDRRRQEQPGIEELAARLVKLDADVARQVFNCLAMRGPCGRMEAVNFILSEPLALALERALDTQSDAPACATAREVREAEVIRLLAEGRTQTEVAAELGISQSQVSYTQKKHALINGGESLRAELAKLAETECEWPRVDRSK